MENRNCKKCGAVFQYTDGYPLCKECRDKDEEEYHAVREYIRIHPGVKIEEVADALGLSPQQILRYLREERLEIPSYSEKFILCEMCGCVIRTGRFCERCKEHINVELKRDRETTLGDTYYYNDEEERKITKMKKKDV